MSATGRGGIRLKDDFYQTPPWAFEWFEEDFRQIMVDYDIKEPLILEPGAGSGNLVRELRRVFPVLQAGSRSRIVAVEKRPECEPMLSSAGARHVVVGDFEGEETARTLVEIASPYRQSYSFDLVLGNPPYGGKKTKTNPHYGIWQRFVQRGLELLAPNGVLIFLLRLAVLETKERNRWIRTHMPDVYVLPKRPAFRGGSSTDSTAYAWMVWPKRDLPNADSIREWGKAKVITDPRVP